MRTRFLNCTFFVVVLVMNYMANALPLNGKTTGELSDQYPNLFVPAGITFSIWGIIYLLLLVFCVVQFFKKYENEVNAMGISVLINFCLNALWIVCWHFEYPGISLMVMIGLLVTLVWINTTLLNSTNSFLKLTFGVYAGWICIATIANVTAFLVSVQWNGFGIDEDTWTIMMILVGSIVAGFTIWRLQNPYIALAVIWGFVGIIINRNSDYQSIVVTAAIAILIVWGVTIYQILSKKRIRVA